MNKILPILLIITNCLFISVCVNAAVYKWVDENGKIHYTDKPPQNLDVEIEEVKIKSNSSGPSLRFPQVRKATPIKNNAESVAKTVSLEYATIKLSNMSSAKTTVVGKALKFNKKGEALVRNINQNVNSLNYPLTCLDDGDLTLNNAEYIIKFVDFVTPFQEVFFNNNYRVVSNSEKRFNMQQKETSDLSLGATIKDIKLAFCGRSNASNLNVYSQNSTYLKIHWEIFDNLSREIIFETETEGLDSSSNKAPKMNGAAVSFGLAFSQSVEGLLSNREFIDVLTHNKLKTTTTKNSANEQGVRNIAVSYGNSSTDFSSQIDEIKKATATVRTKSGHGSGFVITQSGYVLTNHHVANENSELIVVIAGIEHAASLVKSDPKRDVALLKIEGSFSGSAVKMSNKGARLGEKIFVIGTPLAELLNFSITSGIISANREMNGKSYYQTDAAVNPGNSGGPVFDEYGNVIGITVSGHFTESGGSQNINYLIPIGSALKSLGIKFSHTTQ